MIDIEIIGANPITIDDTTQGVVPESTHNFIDKPTDSRNLEVGDIFYGSITTNKGKRCKITGIFKVTSKKENQLQVNKMDSDEDFKTSTGGTKTKSMSSANKALQEFIQTIMDNIQSDKESEENNESETTDKKEEDKDKFKIPFEFEKLMPEAKLHVTIEAGINNIWMVGPAGCGKSTMARNVANTLDVPYLCISCSIGTSATEFVGYKYPTREATKFAEYYAKPSIILLDEFTALDPSVAQVCNAALANDEIETTTGLVRRHLNCVIIATSNTFGNGADRQYVANNQLDSSTIDRFIGGIIEVNYSAEFESQYDEEVVEYVNGIRSIIKENDLRRIASTRMIQAGHKLKKCKFKDWKERLVINWTESEKSIIKDNINRFCIARSNTGKKIFEKQTAFNKAA